MLRDNYIDIRVYAFTKLLVRLEDHHKIDGIAVLYEKLPIKLQLHLKKLGANESLLPDITLFRSY